MYEQAMWIGCEENFGDICPEFMREIEPAGEIKKATLSLTAIGVYEAFLNGERVGDFVLAPGCTVFGKRLQYQEYDVTDMLMPRGCQKRGEGDVSEAEDGCKRGEGTSRLTVTVGTGWHRGRISAGSKEINEMPAAIIGQLEITYADGRTDTIVTDGRWQVRRSRIVFSDIYDGETFDAAAEEDTYRAVKVLPELSKERLIPQEGEKIREHERIKPVKYLVTPKGGRVLDFGQNLAGVMEFSVDAKKGDRIVISCAEILDKDGNVYTENYRAAKSKLTYICREGRQSYKARLTFFGFRYLRLDEYPGEINTEDFTAVAIYSDMERTGFIECGDARVNQLFSNTLWSQRSNFIDIPTDCPQRDERMGWTGDAQVFCKTASYNYNVKKFFEKWLGDVRAEQYEDGMVCDIVPNFWRMRRGSTAWGDVITIVPWQMYLTYGDKKVLKDNFDAMKRWVDYMTKDSLDSYLWTCAPEQKKLWGKHYGDWLAQDAPYGSYIGATDVDFVSSAFYAYSVSLLVKAGKALGRDVREYEELYGNIVKTFKERFPKPDTQTAHVLALQFGLTDDRERTAEELVRLIRENGNRLQTGFVGTPYLLHVLSENGYADVAYDLLLQEAFPSWLYEVEHGATTIWEHWDGIRDDGTIWSKDMNSYNHYAYGCVMDWIYGAAAGIRTVEEHPGFERVVFKPMPDERLGWLNVSLKTARGTIRSKWSCQGDGVRYEISTPVEARVIIGEKEYAVGKGDYIFYGEGSGKRGKRGGVKQCQN